MSLPDLKELYDEYNKNYFKGELPNVELVWNTRYTTRGGTCHYEWVDVVNRIVKPSKISINQRLLADNPDNLRRTLIHEMVHVWRAHKTGFRCGHDIRFSCKMDSIFGFKESHRCHNYDTSKLREKRLIDYVCPNHGVVGTRARMPRAYDLNRYHCNHCGSKISFVDNRKGKAIKNGSLSIKLRLK